MEEWFILESTPDKETQTQELRLCVGLVIFFYKMTKQRYFRKKRGGK